MKSEQQETNLSENGGNIPGFPYEISFIDCDSSDALRSKIEKHMMKIERLYPRVTECKVMVRLPHKTHGQKCFHIHIQLDIPGQRLMISREPEADDAHGDAYVAVHDAFQKLTRRLEDFVKQRKDKRVHSKQPAQADPTTF